MRTSCCGLFLVILLATAALPVSGRAAGAGDIVVFFKASDLQGQPVSLGDLVARRRVAVLFWDWRRATSSRAMQALDRLQDLYRKRGLEVVAVEGEGGSVAQVIERVEKLRAIGNAQRYTIVPDPGGRLARQFRVENTPQVFLLDGAGRVFFHLEGFRAEDEPVLEERVKAVLGIAAPLAPPASQAAASQRVPEVVAAPESLREKPPAEDPTLALLEKYRYFGNYHLNRAEPAKAEEYFRKIVELAPNDTTGWLHVGESCARQRRYDQAREAWERVLRIEPGNREADDNIRRLIRGEY
ncbi:MAG: peroxiredoxin family protein [Candidatus Methylomirabilia bacterium]